MLVDSSLLRRKLRSLALRIFHRLENNGNADFHVNGEETAAAAILRWHRDTPGLVIMDVGANKGAYAETLLAQCRREQAGHPFGRAYRDRTQAAAFEMRQRLHQSGYHHIDVSAGH